MKNVTKSLVVLVLSLVILAFAFESRCNKMDASSIQYVPTSGEVETIILPRQDSSPIKLSIEIFPKEIYVGDTVYLVVYCENISGDAVEIIDSRNFPMYEYSDGRFTLSSAVTNKEYTWIPEYLSNSFASRFALSKDLKPGERYSNSKYYLEFPPLEDLKEPFWKELLANMPKEGVTCNLHIKYYYSDVVPGEPGKPRKPAGDRTKGNSTEIEQDILIKPRPKNEMVLLNKWYKNTPKKLFPKEEDNRNCKVPQHVYDLRSSGKSDIWIGWRKYDPWLFIRHGNRKPSDPNNPTTLDGWRKLEASLTPSTMRDEVRLTRLQLEFYSAQKGEASENAKNELVEWLKSLPEVQRTVMTTFLVGQMGRYEYAHYRRKPWGEKQELIRSGKSQELILAIYDMLDSGSQENAYDREGHCFEDHILPPPASVKAVMEALGPTAEDLAYGTKDLPDGFRIWDVHHRGRSKRMLIVAQFVRAYLPEGQIGSVLLKTRNGEDYPISNMSLSEEDQQYAREQSRKAANGE